MSDITISRGDYGHPLGFTVLNDDDTAFNLTGYTITMYVWAVDMPETIAGTGTCVIDVAASGTCHYTPVATDFVAKGDYLIILRCTKTGAQATTRQYTLTVEDTP